MIKEIFIDLDGTLIDSIPVLYNTYLDLLKERGKEGTRAEFEKLVGLSLPEIARVLKERYAFRDPYEILFSRYLILLQHHYVVSPVLFPGVFAVMEYAKSNGILLALVTSSPRQLAQDILEKVGLLTIFDFVITPEGLPHSKPDPAIYLRALSEAGVQPDEALAIEDSPNGIASAEGAGIPTLGFRTDAGGIAKVDSWDDILKFVMEHQHGYI